MKKTTNELRELRKQAKVIAENLDSATLEQLEKVQQVMPWMSATGFVFCQVWMKQAGFDWLPGLDMKTYKGWKTFWMTVKKGEKSKVAGITWLWVKNKEDEEFLMPKQYNLFHTSQVQ